jgi:hypothetical protein
MLLEKLTDIRVTRGGWAIVTATLSEKWRHPIVLTVITRVESTCKVLRGSTLEIFKDKTMNKIFYIIVKNTRYLCHLFYSLSYKFIFMIHQYFNFTLLFNFLYEIV